MWTSKFVCKNLVFNCIYIHSNQIFIYFYMINCNIIVCVGKLLNKCSFTTFNSLSNIYFIEHNEISLLTSKRLLSIQFENNIFTPNWSYQFFFSRLVNVIIGLFVTFNFVHSYYFSRITHLIKSSSPITIEPGAIFFRFLFENLLFIILVSWHMKHANSYRLFWIMFQNSEHCCMTHLLIVKIKLHYLTEFLSLIFYIYDTNLNYISPHSPRVLIQYWM